MGAKQDPSIHITLFGIPNCDTIKKARKWLEQHHIHYTFHDLRKDGLTDKQVQSWLDAFGWEAVLNRRGSTWRRLSQAERDGVNADNVLALLLDHPSMIKRPILQVSDEQHLGFNTSTYRRIFQR